jgi:hypothetical protein
VDFLFAYAGSTDKGIQISSIRSFDPKHLSFFNCTCNSEMVVVHDLMLEVIFLFLVSGLKNSTCGDER